MAWSGTCRFKEFIFYLSGFGAMLLIYIWCDEVWVPAYGVADYGDVRRHPPYVIQPHWQSLLWASVSWRSRLCTRSSSRPSSPIVTSGKASP